MGARERFQAVGVFSAGEVHGGDRLPWVHTDSMDNFTALRSLDWQMQVYGESQPDFEQVCHQLGLPIQVFSSTEQAGKAGLRRNAAYLVRPDAYISLATSEQSRSALIDFVDSFALHFHG